MLFNSVEFIFLFLPIVLLGFYILFAFKRRELVLAWLACASVIFYAYWNYWYVGLVLASILMNYAFGVQLRRRDWPENRRKVAFVAILVIDLALLFYYKYYNFFMDSVHAVTGLDLTVAGIILPIGISFFTFQQIAFVADVYFRKTVEFDFLTYVTFITFFPHLIAGPICYHKELMPQFSQLDPTDRGHLWESVSVGWTLFVLGLGKKMLIADTISQVSTPAFADFAAGAEPNFWVAWAAALAYTFQIYFDFSGYSDMAIGLGWMFGIRLPINFASPYKAVSIRDFWRRWHITLSRYFRDYLYIPLGGNRLGVRRQKINLMITMLLTGMWHGANWTFCLWGGMHGIFLIVHQWFTTRRGRPLSPWLGRIITFVCVVFAWVPFRADRFDTVFSIYAGMLGLNGVGLPSHASLWLWGVEFPLLFLMVWFLPNTYQWLARYQPGLSSKGYPDTEIKPDVRGRLTWRLGWQTVVLVAGIFTACVVKLNDISEFIYFQF